jgi:hypothetical protein
VPSCRSFNVPTLLFEANMSRGMQGSRVILCCVIGVEEHGVNEDAAAI